MVGMNRFTVLVRLSASLAIASGLAFVEDARSEPYLAAFKGMHCSSCHSHPAGGGKRTVYGNAYAQSELAATRLGNADADLWTGEVMQWLSVGADIRGGYRYADVPGEDDTSAFDIFRGNVYLEANLIPNRLSIYIDQQIAPGSSLNREAYISYRGSGQKLRFSVGQFYLGYGLRLQDDTAFIRQFTGINFTNPDRGVQVTYESGPWSTVLSLSNGAGGGSETDTGKQVSLLATYVRPGWRAGLSFNSNNADVGNRQMQNVFVGLKTGPIAWLFEADLIIDDLPGGVERDAIAALAEGNWMIRQGHNLKISYDYFDPDNDIDEDHQVRWSVLWEYSPIQFLQGRLGVRVYDGVPANNFQNRDEAFAELHAFF